MEPKQKQYPAVDVTGDRSILGVAGRLSGTVSPFRAEQGTLGSPGSQGSESILSVVSGGVGISAQGDQTSQDPSNSSLAYFTLLDGL